MKLSSLQNSLGQFTISAFDHRSSLVNLLKLDESDTQALTQQMISLKSLFMRTFSPLSSAVLTDPIYGIHTLQDKDPNCGLLMSLEESGYDSEKSDIPTLVEHWGIHGIKGHGGAAKFLLYFHPDEQHAREKMDQVMQLYTQAMKEEVPLLVEVVLYPIESKEEFQKSWSSLQMRTVELFDGMCDVLKIEYPGLYAQDEKEARKNCEKITQVSNVPWIILSRGMEFEKFKKAVEISHSAGAKGFAVGRAVWQEVDQFSLDRTGNFYTSLDKINEFFRTTAVERFSQLVSIVNS